MNALAVWKTTSATIDRQQRRFIAAFWILFGIVAIAFMRSRGTAGVGLLIYAFGMAFWWTFVVGRALLLQRDARSLGIPGVDRTVVANVLLQYALSALLPALLVAGFGLANFLGCAAVFSCIAAGALLFQSLPRSIGMFMAIMPTVLQQLSAHGVIPGLADAGFVLFGWSLAIAMAAIAIWRWRVVLNTPAEAFGSWSVPLVIQMQRQLGLSGGFRTWDGNLISGSVGKSRLHLQARLAGIGPRTPIRALRTWLGGAFVAVSLQARLSQVAFVVLPMIITVGFSVFGRSSPAGWAVLIVFVGGSMIPLMIVSMAPTRLQRLYTEAGGELSLLALLPNFDAAKAKGHLYAAALSVPFIALAMFYALVAVSSVALGIGPRVILALTLCTLGAVGFSASLSLGILSGKPVPKVIIFLICMLGLILLFTSPSLLALPDPGPEIRATTKIVVAGWIVLYVTFAGLLVRGFAACSRRPHAFLLNDR